MPARLEAFRLGLRERGWIEGRNVTVEYRRAEGGNDRLLGLADELVALKVDVIVTHGALATLAARRATTVTPIVFASADEAVATGLVASLAHPGGNLTGLTIIASQLSGKRLELIREVIPAVRRVAVLRNPRNPVSLPELEETESAARSLTHRDGRSAVRLLSTSSRKPQHSSGIKRCETLLPSNSCCYSPVMLSSR